VGHDLCPCQKSEGGRKLEKWEKEIAGLWDLKKKETWNGGGSAAAGASVLGRDLIEGSWRESRGGPKPQKNTQRNCKKVTRSGLLGLEKER